MPHLDRPQPLRTRLATLCALACWVCTCQSTLAADTDSVQQHILRVENGLSPAIVVKGVKGLEKQDGRLAARMAALHVPGVSIALINNGAIEWARVYGVADSGGKQVLSVDTLFQAAAISKPLAAMAALSLVEQGKLTLDGDANERLVSWKLPASTWSKEQKVNLRALLSHTAGLSGGGSDTAPGVALPTLLELLDGTGPANAPPVRSDSTPGSKWRYSDAGFGVAQLMMMDVTGKPFTRFMQNSVLDPLKMHRSTFEQPLPAKWQAAAATGHDRSGQPMAGKWQSHPNLAAEGLWSTPSDLARFAIEMQQAVSGKGKVLSQPMAETMLTEVMASYGMGLFVLRKGADAAFSHGGSSDGFRAMMFVYARSGQGAVLMTNGENGSALIAEILCAIAAEYGWQDHRAIEKTAIAADAGANARVAGQYKMAGAPLEVLADGERLFVKMAGLGPNRVEIYPEAKGRYFMAGPPLVFTFEDDAAGAVAGVLVADGPRINQATKMK